MELYVHAYVHVALGNTVCCKKSMPTFRFFSLITAAALDFLLTLFLQPLKLLSSQQRKRGGLEH